MNYCLQLYIHVLDAQIFMFSLFEFLVFFVDFFLKFLAVILSLTPTESLNLNFVAKFRIIFSQSLNFDGELTDSLLLLAALDV